jgi:hypothetical protein
MAERVCDLSEAVKMAFKGFGAPADISGAAITRRPKHRIPTTFLHRVRWSNFGAHPARGHFRSFQQRSLRPEKAAATFKKCKFRFSRNLMICQFPILQLLTI